MGTWGEGPLDNDTAGDLAVFWDDVIERGRARDPEGWTAERIAELFRFLYFGGYGDLRPESPSTAERLLAVGALFQQHNVAMPDALKALVVSAVNFELRRSRTSEWAEPGRRKRALEAFLAEMGGERLPSKDRRRDPTKDTVEIEAFVKRIAHWVAVVKFETSYDPAYETAEPQFVGELKQFVVANTRTEDQKETRRTIRARLKALAYVAGWYLNLPSPDIVGLVRSADAVTSPSGQGDVVWAAEAFAGWVDG